MFLGLNGIVIKSHGGTDAEGFAAAIDVGYDMVRYEPAQRRSAQALAPNTSGAQDAPSMVGERCLVSALRSVVIGCGSYLPQRVLTNDDLARMVDTSDEWIVQRTGIRERHIAAPASSLPTSALQRRARGARRCRRRCQTIST